MTSARTPRTATALAPLLLTLIGGLVACKGPDERTRAIPLNIDSERLAVEWQDGPRREAAEAKMRREARRVAKRLFRGEPMPNDVPEEAEDGSADEASDDPASPNRPSWADGVAEPPSVLAHDLPQAWPVEVRRGETPALLAKWSGTTVRAILTDNGEALGKRKWLRTKDRLMVTMSANQKVAFDEARVRFQEERLSAYFAKRYFEKVVVYRVRRGEYVATAAKRYGDVPLWLLEDFNRIDFRSLQAGDEILLPVIGTFEPGKKTPPEMAVVDEEGRPLSEERRARIATKLSADLMGTARMALDDSNVFERGDSVFNEASRALLPDYGAVKAAEPELHVGAAPIPAVERPVARDIIIKHHETLLHYIEWSGTTLAAIKAANPHLQPDRILVGSRLALPLTDLQYVDFVKARASWHGGRSSAAAPKAAPKEAPKKPVAKVAAAPAPRPARHHTIRPGDTVTAIARRYGVTMSAIKAENPTTNLDRIRAGQQLRVPFVKAPN